MTPFAHGVHLLADWDEEEQTGFVRRVLYSSPQDAHATGPRGTGRLAAGSTPAASAPPERSPPAAQARQSLHAGAAEPPGHPGESLPT